MPLRIHRVVAIDLFCQGRSMGEDMHEGQVVPRTKGRSAMRGFGERTQPGSPGHAEDMCS